MRTRSKGTVWRKIGQFLFLVLIHMVLSLPFKVMIMIPGFTLSLIHISVCGICMANCPVGNG